MTDGLIEAWKEDKDKNKSTANRIINDLQQASINDLDVKIQHIYQSVTEKIDCLGCANCCKTTVTVFTEDDIARIAKFLGITRKSFIRRYVILDQGEYTTITTPCPFLEIDNKCAVYEVRPMACSSFPHLGRKNFLNRKKAHIENFLVCPITYHTLNQIPLEILK